MKKVFYIFMVRVMMPLRHNTMGNPLVKQPFFCVLLIS